MSNRSIRCLLLGLLTVASWTTWTEAAYLRNVPVKAKQPDGTVLNLLASGDEYYNWLHDKDGYTILRDPANGLLVYAGKVEGQLVPTAFIAGQTDVLLLERAGIQKKLIDDRRPRKMVLAVGESEPVVNAPSLGTINNLVVYIRFSNQEEFDPALLDAAEVAFNSSDAGVNSFRNYFVEASYNQLTIGTTFYPGSTPGVYSYQDSHPRAYYMPYDASTNPAGYNGDAERTTREHTLLMNAVNAISAEVPVGLNIDGDSDGRVDNVCFIVKGGPTGWNSLLWPHMWSLYTYTVNINGKRVWTYNLQFEDIFNTWVLCHEMFHSLGAPDLYHNNEGAYETLEPVWIWDVMGEDPSEYYNQLYPPPFHMGAYMKRVYGKWISLTEEDVANAEIKTSGIYTLSPLTSPTNNWLWVRSPSSVTQYFVFEYRKRDGTFEGNLPSEGLLVYRIDQAEALEANGNIDFPPDEVYIYRPGGRPWENGTPLLAPFSADNGRIRIDDNTDPSSFLWDWSAGGSPGGLKVIDVGAMGSTISFSISIGSVAVTAPNGGESWNSGTNETVSWTSSGTIGSIDISLSIDGGMTWAPLVEDTANDGSEVVTVPSGLSSNCLIRVAEGSIGAPSDTSDEAFSIAPIYTSISLTSPNGGESWLVGSLQAITWSWTGTIGTIAMDYSTDGGDSWIPITASTPNTGSISWTVPASPSSSCLIRVSDASNGAISDTNDGSFSIICVEMGTAYWAKAIGGAGYDHPVAIKQTSDGGFIIVANTASWGGNYDTWVIKLRKDGQREWDKLYRASNGYAAVAIEQTSNNGYLILSSRVSDDFATLLLRISETGIPLWQKAFNGGDTTYPISFYRTTDNGCVIAGSPNDPGIPAWIMRVSPEGNPIWLRKFGTDQVNYIASIAQANDGGIIVVGGANIEPSGTLIVLKLTSEGEIDPTAGWQNLLQPSEATPISTTEIKATTDGGYGVMGSTWTQLWFARLSSGGEVSWQFTYSGTGLYGQPESFQQTPDGGFIITGINMLGGNKAYLVRLDATGSFAWGKLINFDLISEGISIINTSDSGFALTGVDGSPSRQDLLTLKLASNGQVSQECSAIQDAVWTREATSLASIGATISLTSATIPNACDEDVSTILPTDIHEITYCLGSALEPVITGISPSSGPAGTEVTITGSNFGAGQGDVLFNDESAAIISWSESLITCTVPSMTTVGLIPLYVRTSDSRTSGSVSFLITLDQGFMITSPNGGEIWLAGSSRSLTWTATAGIDAVAIDYSVDGGQNWLAITSSAPNSGSYGWTVPFAPSASCLVKIADVSNRYISDTSDSLFSIVLDRSIALTKLGEWPGHQVDSIWLEGNFAYCGTGTYGYFGLDIINISNPSIPVGVGHADTAGYSEGVCTRGSISYLADGYSGLLIFDVSNPASPNLIGVYDTPGLAYDVFVVGNYAYLIDQDTAFTDSGMLFILDISDPSSPLLVGSTTAGTFPNEIFISGDHAYISLDLGGLQIVDISNPASPAHVGYFSMGWSNAKGVFVRGNYAYLADWFYGLQIVDISNPADLHLVATYGTSHANCVFVSGRYAYLAAADHGLKVIDVANPASPGLAASYDTPGYARHVVARDNIIFIADDTSLFILGASEITKDDFMGSWDGQGVFYRNSDSGVYVKLASAATMITCGDIDQDGIDDVIGLWPTQGGIWVKYSGTGAWAKLSSTAVHIASGDMNGDGRDDLLGTWDGQGVFYRDSVTGSWIKLASPANLITAGDIDADGTDDLIGVWPSQGGVWVKYSASGSWAKLSSTARDIAAGDMNGDGRDDLLATWDGQGVYYRNSATGSWAKMASQADQVTCGIIDDDNIEDLIGIWPGQGGVWIKSSVSGSWAKISSTARDIAAGPMRAAGTMSAAASLELPNEIARANGRLSTGPEDAADRQDFSAYGPGGVEFSYRQEKNPVPREENIAKRARLRSRSPGEPGFVCEEQKNLSPGEVREQKKEEQPKVKKVARESAQ